MFAFESPFALLLLFGIPVYFLLVQGRILKKPSILLTLFDWGSSSFPLISPVVSVLLFVSKAALYVAFFSTVLALAAPVQYTQEDVFNRAGASIVFVLDASPSMSARDIGQKTRFVAAKDFISSFIERRGQDSFALVALGSEAALLIPPTTDHATLLTRLSLLSVGELGDGTALGMALSVAAAHLVDAVTGNKTVVLLTDGENNAGEIHPLVAAEMLKQHMISLYVIGIGTRGDVPVEYTDAQTLKTYSGILASDFNETSLRSLAERARGTYSSVTSADTLEKVLLSIDAEVPVLQSSFQKPVEHSLSHVFIHIALLSVAFFWCIRRLMLRSFI